RLTHALRRELSAEKNLKTKCPEAFRLPGTRLFNGFFLRPGKPLWGRTGSRRPAAAEAPTSIDLRMKSGRRKFFRLLCQIMRQGSKVFIN
ncbi:MAG TPA: hypothetical protein PLD83_02395, partial [Oscillospiraceae bacterium]|nr:hypothetical protein [Oscillospiraceae bacterium]